MASSIQNNRVMGSSYCSCFRVCNMWCWRAFKWLPVLLIVAIVTWSYYAYVIQLCIFAIENTVQKCFYLVFYHILLVMFMWSYWQTIFSEVQPIPEKFRLPDSELERLLSAENEDAQRVILENFAKNLPIVTRTMSGSVRYCNRCVLVKPDRAHHCSMCARCVLKMDHHCPWVNNCVCFHNYKFFILFLGYALLYCLFIMFTSLPSFIRFWKMYQDFKHAHCDNLVENNTNTSHCLDLIIGEFGSTGNSGRYHVVFAFFVALMFAISLGSLFVYHCYLVTRNRTTLEAFRAPMFRSGADKNGFSLGAFKNFKQVFGENPSLWFIPVFTSAGDGATFPVRREHEARPAAPDPDHDRDRDHAPDHGHGYESMGTTRSSFGDGLAYPLPPQEEDLESLLSSERWERWGERARPYEEQLESSSYDEL